MKEVHNLLLHKNPHHAKNLIIHIYSLHSLPMNICRWKYELDHVDKIAMLLKS